ncbi:hypothetical protein [Dyella sp.]|uniref:hypothetical protein n=1 Tax=Dyella sp. TaxID=1869338 RepID=UPI002D79B238|nr:hypothetical protein [Dyella sp.]HET7332625.1 hypothetical protein [Dyella sp.]
MSIRNATIARRKRTIGLFEQERIASAEHEWPQRVSLPARPRKKDASPTKKAQRAPWHGA